MAGVGGCPRCRELEAEVERLKRRVAELEASLEQAQRAAKRQAAPFRRRRKVGRGQRKSPGRPPGHAAAHRSAPDHIDEQYHVPLECCPECGGPLQDRRQHEQTQVDIPEPVRPVCRKFVVESGYCPSCQKRFQSRHDKQTSDAVGAAAHQIGPNALAFAVHAKYRLGIPLAKICELLGRFFKLEISPATICRASQRIARAAEPTVEELIGQLRQSGVVNVDETGWRVAGANSWLWVFTTSDLTVYVIRHSRGHQVLVEVLGEEYGGIVGCDGFGAYRVLGCRKAQCLAHLLRRAAELEEVQRGRAVQFPRLVGRVLREAISLGARREEYTARGFAVRVRGLERRLDKILGARLSSELNRKFRDHLRRHREEIFTFLHESGVEATNNRAERAIRPAVVVRKISAGNRSQAGAKTHGILTSLITTCIQRGHDFIRCIRDLLHMKEPRPLPVVHQDTS